MTVSGRFNKKRGLIFDLMTRVAKDTHSGGSRTVIFGIQQPAQERLIDTIQPPANPQRFKKVMFMMGVAFC